MRSIASNRGTSQITVSGITNFCAGLRYPFEYKLV